ncbi:hypothetical protein [Lewinella sp. 4G2]|uniref:hypothetical protein n=1 Tax=Lewinella sp. 4G2 TaxID=1803372 RepID=UPI0007B4C92C|nr:hypothetical protein [Lewinella sp. 4G2]OAV43991.1 hypothetical protein A3850_005550 [Lewinella sp. 4G2]
MKFRFLTLFTSLLLIAACSPEEVDVNPAPSLLGFGDQAGTVAVTGDTARAKILWTRATDREVELAFELRGDGVSGNDLEVLTPSPLRIPAGATEADIELRVAPGSDPERLERSGVIQLLEGNWYRLSERDTFTFNYSVPHTAELSLWAPEIPFPKLWGYTSFGPDPVPDGSSLSAGRHFAFGHASTTQANVLGMFNTQVGKSTNALNLHRIYADYDVSSASANIRIPNLFRLVPTFLGADAGAVEVIEQRVTVVRKASSGLPPFTIGISGEGTYDETTGAISVAILFDESELGVTEPVLRRYVYESQER